MKKRQRILSSPKEKWSQSIIQNTYFIFLISQGKKFKRKLPLINNKFGNVFPSLQWKSSYWNDLPVEAYKIWPTIPIEGKFPNQLAKGDKKINPPLKASLRLLVWFKGITARPTKPCPNPFLPKNLKETNPRQKLTFSLAKKNLLFILLGFAHVTKIKDFPEI